MPGYTMTIDGQSVKGSKSTGVINPASGKVFAEVPDCTKAELDQAMSGAQRAFFGDRKGRLALRKSRWLTRSSCEARASKTSYNVVTAVASGYREIRAIPGGVAFF